jgi:hypothetical protein
VCGKCRENLLLLLLGHLEEVERAPELSRDFVELGRRDLQFAIGFFQAERCFTWLRGCIVLGATGNVADPESAQELEAKLTGSRHDSTSSQTTTERLDRPATLEMKASISSPGHSRSFLNGIAGKRRRNPSQRLGLLLRQASWAGI